MSESEKDADPGANDDTVARLLRLAGEREQVPADAAARVYEKVTREWEASTSLPQGDTAYREVRKAWSRSRRRRWYLPLALAASALLVVLLRPAVEPPAAPPVTVATVVKRVGTSTSSLPGPGAPVLAGDVLATGADEGISLRLAGNESIRLGPDTRLRIDDSDQLALEYGRVYADTGEFIYRDGGLSIGTPLGEVRDIGTQFAVVLADSLLDVGVREGRVDIQISGGDVQVAMAGERLLLAPGQQPERATVAASDDYWNWATRLAPGFDIENRSLLDFLRWAARETGRELVFTNEELRLAAMRADLHGSVSQMEPVTAVHSVLPTTAFNYRVEDKRIVIEP